MASTRNRIITDLDPKTYKAILAYEQATGKKRSAILREILREATPSINKMTVQIYKLREAQSPQKLIEAFTHSVHASMQLESDEK